MPKIIENIRQTLLCEAKRQVAESGYAKTTIRSVAGACNVGVGTVYNYFDSKEMLIATFMLEDWKITVGNMKYGADEDCKSSLKRIYLGLCDYIQAHAKLFSDDEAAKIFATAFAQRHNMLRGQISELILPLAVKTEHPDTAFLADFIAESLISWSTEGKPFEDVFSVVKLLLR